MDKLIQIYKLVPLKLREWVNAQIIYADANTTMSKYLNKTIITSLIIGIISIFMSYYFYNLFTFEAISVGVSLFLIVFVTFLFLIMNSADSRGAKAEKSLPDALELIASNIKSGLTTERAIFVSALPEFGALSKELINVSKELVAGEKIEQALLGVPRKIKSEVIDKTIWLLVQGIKNGGQISNLLTQMSSDLREENALKGEASANVSMYVILIFVSAAFGAPALYGISSFIVGVLSSQAANVGVSPEQIAGYATSSPALGLVGIPSATITEEFIVFFSIIALIITSLFASFVLGIISNGKERAGVKYIPVLLIVSLLLFFVVRTLVKGAFGGFA